MQKVPRIVLDTNVFISGLKSPDSPPAIILDLWKSKKIILLSSTHMLQELHDVLLRPQIVKLLKKTKKDVNKFILFYWKNSIAVHGESTVIDLPDPDDTIFLSCAVEGNASHLITGNKKHFPHDIYEGVKIVSPRQFINERGLRQG